MFGILCGLESEAALARQIKGAVVVCSGARPERARYLARDMVRHGASRLMSFGIAGGLSLGLPLGALVVGTRVMAPHGAWACDETWGLELASRLPTAQRGGVWGSDFLVGQAAQKQALYNQHDCLIVDMESHCLAEAAAEVGVPMMVVRAVCDTAEMDVPPIVMAAINEDGGINVPRALGHIVRNPRQIPDLFHIGRGTKAALGSLAESLSLLGRVA